jgi:hypothetical protein
MGRRRNEQALAPRKEESDIMDMKDVVKEAMFNLLDQAKRDELIKSALASLLKEPTGVYSRDKSTPLQEAFETEARAICRELVKEFLAGDSAEAGKLREGIRDMVVKGWERALTQGDAIVDKIASSIAYNISMSER